MMNEFRKTTNRIYKNRMKEVKEAVREDSRAKAFKKILSTKFEQLTYEVGGETKYRGRKIRAFDNNEDFYIDVTGDKDDIRVVLRVYPPNKRGERYVDYCGFTDSSQKNVEFAENTLAKDIGIELKGEKYKIL